MSNIVRISNRILRIGGKIVNELTPYTPPPPPDYVVIGTQTWKNSNLAIDDGQGGIEIRDGIYYYSYDAAVRVASSVDGYHLPSKDEVTTLLNYVGSTSEERFYALASRSGWYVNGNDTYGFNATPAYYPTVNPSQQDIREARTLPLCIIDQSSNYYGFYISDFKYYTGYDGRGAFLEKQVNVEYLFTNTNKFCVRLIKDN